MIFLSNFYSLDDALEANDLVTTVSHKYHQLLVNNKPKNSNACLISTSDPKAVASCQNGTAKNTMDELSEIFLSSGSGSSNSNTNSHSNAQPALNSTPLEPILVSAPAVNKNGNFR